MLKTMPTCMVHKSIWVIMFILKRKAQKMDFPYVDFYRPLSVVTEMLMHVLHIHDLFNIQNSL
jgi:hypothetical protein